MVKHRKHDVLHFVSTQFSLSLPSQSCRTFHATHHQKCEISPSTSAHISFKTIFLNISIIQAASYFNNLNRQQTVLVWFFLFKLVYCENPTLITKWIHSKIWYYFSLYVFICFLFDILNTHVFHQNVLRLYLKMCFGALKAPFELALKDSKSVNNVAIL